MIKLNPYAKLDLEMMTYAVASKYIDGYSGGKWVFKRDSQTYSLDGKGKVTVLGQFESPEVSVKVASLICSQIAINQLAWRAAESNKNGQADLWNRYYYQFRDLLWSDENPLKLSQSDKDAIYSVCE
jgi:hypothetical protein